MKEIASEIALLIVKQMEGTITNKELEQLNEWVSASPSNYALYSRLNDPDKLQLLLRGLYHAEETLAALNSSTPATNIKVSKFKKSNFKIYYQYAAAAAVIVLITTCAYLFFFSYQKPSTFTKTNTPPTYDAMPGGQKATLILADKSKIDLTDAPEGIIARQGETAIKKMGGGNLKYEGSGTSGLNTLITPKGGVYNLSFSDGSKVWLNAESSIRYPATFTGKIRKVELVSGEAYFEVAKNEKMPFIVQSGNVAIQVLGTRFNFKAYNNEEIAATLLQGSVQISTGNEANSVKKLVPGQEAVVNRNTSGIELHETDAETSIFWVKNKFYFNHCPLREVTRQLERWYDVQFILEEGVASDAGTFQGDMERTITLSKTLANLSRLGNFEYEIKDKKVVLSKAKK